MKEGSLCSVFIHTSYFILSPSNVWPLQANGLPHPRQQFSLWDEWDEWDEWRMVPSGLGHPKGWTPYLPDQPK